MGLNLAKRGPLKGIPYIQPSAPTIDLHQLKFSSTSMPTRVVAEGNRIIVSTQIIYKKLRMTLDNDNFNISFSLLRTRLY